MKVIEMMKRLGLWPFAMALDDASRVDSGVPSDTPPSTRAIVLPTDMRPMAQAARWPTEYDRRTRH